MRKMMLIVLCVAVAMLIGSSTALAFHDGGVAYCAGCHTMHNSQNGVMVDPNAPEGNNWLLKDETPSDVCLSCHSQSATSTSTNGRYVLSYNMMSPMAEQGAGDFAFLLEDNLNDGHNGNLPANWIPGYKGGHSIVAPSKNLAADPVLAMGPGGNFPSAMMGCTSCHDPHGNEHFRLLNTEGPIQDGIYEFVNPAPEAVGINLSSNNVEANNNHTAYQGGMSEWCANCHADFHNSTHNLHPSGSAINGEEIQHYNLYLGTANQTGGNPATAYLAMVPFEDAGMTISSTAGPTATSKVICLTCHRAHATTGPDIGRWDFNVAVWSEEGVASGSWAIPNPFAAGADQRSACNKCHVKDEGDELFP